MTMIAERTYISKFKTTARAGRLAKKLNEKFGLSLEPYVRRVTGSSIKFQMKDSTGKIYSFKNLVLEFMPKNVVIELTGRTFSTNGTVMEDPFLEKIKAAIAEEYYNSPDTIAETARKFGISAAEVSRIGMQSGRRVAEPEPEQPKDLVVIKVEPKWVPHIQELLERRNIYCEVPEKFELTEYYESKM